MSLFDDDKDLTGALTGHATVGTNSAYLRPGERSWETVIAQSGKPLLDREAVLWQEIDLDRTLRILRQTTASGFLGTDPLSMAPDRAFEFAAPSSHADFVNGFRMAKRPAIVAGMPLTIEYTNTTVAGRNVITLPAPPPNSAGPGVQRSDFVYLEVWRALVTMSPRASATLTVASTPGTSTITYDFTAVGGGAAVPLTPAGGPRTPGADDFDDTLASTDLIAIEIAAAINDVANSFAGFISATALASTVTLYSVTGGATANGILQVSSAPLVITATSPFAGGVDTENKPSEDTLYHHGNVTSPLAAALPDDIEDETLATESTRRVQVQYAVRVVDPAVIVGGVNFKSDPLGFTDAALEAQGPQAAPVAGYSFSRATEASAYAIDDPSLWFAGTGSDADKTALGTVDGFVYAIPLGYAFRREDRTVGPPVGWDSNANAVAALLSTHVGVVNTQTGVAIAAGNSDRPDGLFADQVVSGDFLDLRPHVKLTGQDWNEVLQKSTSMVMDNTLRTWAFDTADHFTLALGDGQTSTLPLMCDILGKAVAPTPPWDVQGNQIGSFDGIRRRFADYPVEEAFTVKYTPAIATPGADHGGPGLAGGDWRETDTLTLDLTLLSADFGKGAVVGPVSSLVPPGTVISNVIVAEHDDGDVGGGTDASREVFLQTVTGLGTTAVVITLMENPSILTQSGLPLIGTVAGAPGSFSARPIFVTYEVSYPRGNGTTLTPQAIDPTALALLSPEIFADVAVTHPGEGPWLEDFAAGPPPSADRPTDFDKYRMEIQTGIREIRSEYRGVSVAETVISDSTSRVILSNRIDEIVSIVEDPGGAALAHGADALTALGSSERLLLIDAGGPNGLLSQPNIDVTVTYYPRYAVPQVDWGVGHYYNIVAPQPVGSGAAVATVLPSPLRLRPLVIGDHVWSSLSGSASVPFTFAGPPALSGLPFPYTNPTDQVPVSGDVSFVGEHQIGGTALDISISDFATNAGVLKLPALLPVVPIEDFLLTTPANDAEVRAMLRFVDTSVYRPFAMAQELSFLSTHKTVQPMLAALADDTLFGPRGTVVLVLFNRYTELNNESTVRYDGAVPGDTVAAIYRVPGNLVTLDD